MANGPAGSLQNGTLWRQAESRAPLLCAVAPVDLAAGLDGAHHQSLVLLLRAHAGAVVQFPFARELWYLEGYRYRVRSPSCSLSIPLTLA